ncbi:hypothetical protein [Saccharibacillus deserti]|uniref:hypothetical protein n=1 Tax=Saccharibacillus deserti TaxID=1634444 RepID=UPI0015563AB8|nr:hypothetical protein [Saccharibacillus deserti]
MLSIKVRAGRVYGVETTEGMIEAGEIVCNGDLLTPERLESEFDGIFKRKVAPDDPALYICNSGYSEPGSAPPGAIYGISSNTMR